MWGIFVHKSWCRDLSSHSKRLMDSVGNIFYHPVLIVSLLAGKQHFPSLLFCFLCLVIRKTYFIFLLFARSVFFFFSFYFIYFFIFWYWGFELRASWLLGRLSTTWAMPPPFYCFYMYLYVYTLFVPIPLPPPPHPNPQPCFGAEPFPLSSPSMLNRKHSR
jgi:hypothetical protein